MSYQGWKNYETWNVALWIGNEEGSYTYWREQTRDAWEQQDHDKDATASALADQLKSEFEEAMPEVQGVWSDLLSAALSEVDWYEIAEHMIEDEDFAEEEEAEGAR